MSGLARLRELTRDCFQAFSKISTRSKKIRKASSRGGFRKWKGAKTKSKKAKRRTLSRISTADENDSAHIAFDLNVSDCSTCGKLSQESTTLELLEAMSEW
jgi:hypothetical protein